MADNFNDIVKTMVNGMDEFLSSKTVVGEPTIVGDTILVPFVDVAFGVGAGNFKKDGKDNSGGGLSGKMTPSAVLVITKGTTRLINIRNQDNVGKILDMIPDIVNKVAEKKNVNISDEDAISAALDE
ncbi:MAG: GerW family sporulation protein [Lachnospiraceae bacterium]|nr:GerW family sporulation protein [Lachnospiraceae bacterium]